MHTKISSTLDIHTYVVRSSSGGTCEVIQRLMPVRANTLWCAANSVNSTTLVRANPNDGTSGAPLSGIPNRMVRKHHSSETVNATPPAQAMAEYAVLTRVVVMGPVL